MFVLCLLYLSISMYIEMILIILLNFMLRKLFSLCFLCVFLMTVPLCPVFWGAGTRQAANLQLFFLAPLVACVKAL